MKILDRIFGKAEEINGANRCPTYLYRWMIVKRKNWAVYLHHFIGDDWTLDLHDHPKRFITFGLKGGYIEWQPCVNPACKQPCDAQTQRIYNAPWVRTFPASHIHRITMFADSAGKPMGCWTLVIVLKATRGWGFWHGGSFCPWREYVESDTADKMKACD